MRYELDIITRMAMALGIFLLPVNLFYMLLTGPTIGLTYLTFIRYFPVIVGNNLLLGGYALRFIPACIAASAYYLIAVLVLLTKDVSLKNRIKLFCLGALLIFVMNIARIDILILILMEYGVNMFSKVHVFFWEFVSSIYVALVWVFLSRRFKIKTIPFYSDFIYLYRRVR